MKTYVFFYLFLSFTLLLTFCSGQGTDCGFFNEGRRCSSGRCCSKWGYCGDSEEYCLPPNCDSQCWGVSLGPSTGSLSDIFTKSLFDDMLKYRNDDHCPAKDFYTYEAFITAAKSFPEFGNTGNKTMRKKEVAAFFAHTSHETTGWGEPRAPGGLYAWGYCYKEERTPSFNYCSDKSPCVNGNSYHGRGPMMLSWNYNYQKCGEAIGEDLLNSPDLVSQDPVIAFKSAIWYWMTPRSSKPSFHDMVSGKWQPSYVDIASWRLPGYGGITNSITHNTAVKDRIGFYKRYCEMLEVNPGENLDVVTIKGHLVA